jgi:excisionase family DNA binding protein
MDDGDRLLTAEQAAGFLGLKVATVRRLTAAGELPVVHPTGRRAVRYRARDLAELTRMRTRPMRQPSTSESARRVRLPEEMAEP